MGGMSNHHLKRNFEMDKFPDQLAWTVAGGYIYLSFILINLLNIDFAWKTIKNKTVYQ